MDYTGWKMRDNSGKIIGQVLKFEKGIDRNKVVQKSLNGVVYIQTIGDGIPYADIDLFCTREQRDFVNVAEASGEYVSVIYRDTKYYGYIEEEPDWNANKPGEYYTATFKLLIEEQEEV